MFHSFARKKSLGSHFSIFPSKYGHFWPVRVPLGDRLFLAGLCCIRAKCCGLQDRTLSIHFPIRQHKLPPWRLGALVHARLAQAARLGNGMDNMPWHKKGASRTIPERALWPARRRSTHRHKYAERINCGAFPVTCAAGRDHQRIRNRSIGFIR
jgi:hypothetical protein